MHKTKLNGKGNEKISVYLPRGHIMAVDITKIFLRADQGIYMSRSAFIATAIKVVDLFDFDWSQIFCDEDVIEQAKKQLKKRRAA